MVDRRRSGLNQLSFEFCLAKRNLGLVEARGLVHNRNEWRGIVRGYGCGPRPGDEPLH